MDFCQESEQEMLRIGSRIPNPLLDERVRCKEASFFYCVLLSSRGQLRYPRASGQMQFSWQFGPLFIEQ